MTILPFLRFDDGISSARVEIDRFYETRLLVQGVSGSGKSTLLRSILEQTHGRVPQFVVDSEGDFVTLREKYDYVLVGQGGDVPIGVKTAKVTIRRLVELGVSAIFDLSELRFPERRDWVRICFEELVHLPRTLWHTRIVALDEAHIFAPERGAGESVSTQAVIDGVSLGRKRGLVPILATQRLSKLHKDAAGELLNKLIGYTDDIDLQRAGDQLGMTKEQRAGLKLLDTHTFYAYGPAISRAPVLVQTFMPATKPPPRGQARPAAPPAREAVKRVLEQLADLPKEAEEEARSIDDLRRQNSDLQRKLRQAEKGVAVQTVTKPVIDQGAIDRAVANALRVERGNRQNAVRVLERVDSHFARGLETLQVGVTGLREVASILRADSQNGNATHSVASVAARHEAVERSTEWVATTGGETARRATPEPRQSLSVPESDLPAGEQKILNAIAELNALGIEETTRAQVGIVSGYNLSGGTASQYVGSLVARALVEIPEAGQLRLTAEGRSIARCDEFPISLDRLHARVLRKLSDGERKILEHLISIYPASESRQDVGLAVSYNLSGGTASQYVGKLVTLGFAEIPKVGQLRASDTLFPEGLR